MRPLHNLTENSSKWLRCRAVNCKKPDPILFNLLFLIDLQSCLCYVSYRVSTLQEENMAFKKMDTDYGFAPMK